MRRQIHLVADEDEFDSMLLDYDDRHPTPSIVRPASQVPQEDTQPVPAKVEESATNNTSDAFNQAGFNRSTFSPADLSHVLNDAPRLTMRPSAILRDVEAELRKEAPLSGTIHFDSIDDSKRSLGFVMEINGRALMLDGQMHMDTFTSVRQVKELAGLLQCVQKELKKQYSKFKGLEDDDLSDEEPTKSKKSHAKKSQQRPQRSCQRELPPKPPTTTEPKEDVTPAVEVHEIDITQTQEPAAVEIDGDEEPLQVEEPLQGIVVEKENETEEHQQEATPVKKTQSQIPSFIDAESEEDEPRPNKRTRSQRNDDDASSEDDSIYSVSSADDSDDDSSSSSDDSEYEDSSDENDDSDGDWDDDERRGKKKKKQDTMARYKRAVAPAAKLPRLSDVSLTHTHDPEELKKLTVGHLKRMLKKAKLPLSGTKDALIDRLHSHFVTISATTSQRDSRSLPRVSVGRLSSTVVKIEEASVCESNARLSVVSSLASQRSIAASEKPEMESIVNDSDSVANTTSPKSMQFQSPTSVAFPTPASIRGSARLSLGEASINELQNQNLNGNTRKSFAGRLSTTSMVAEQLVPAAPIVTLQDVSPAPAAPPLRRNSTSTFNIFSKKNPSPMNATRSLPMIQQVMPAAENEITANVSRAASANDVQSDDESMSKSRSAFANFFSKFF